MSGGMFCPAARIVHVVPSEIDDILKNAGGTDPEDNPSSSGDDRQTYGPGGYNPNRGGGQEGSSGGPLNGPEASGAATGLARRPNGGDNPFEISAADALNPGKLVNGAKDPTRH
jgi:hypothetical protein